MRVLSVTVCVPITDSISGLFAGIKQILKKKGRPIPIKDVWIAASSMKHGSRLISFYNHFSEIDGLLIHDTGFLCHF